MGATMRLDGLLGILSIAGMTLGQIDPGQPMGWLSNITGMGLAVFIVVRLGGSIDRLNESITALREHCAMVRGENSTKK